MTAFHEILFPLDIALKSAGGPQRRTDVIVLGSGREERNARWAHSRRRYDAGYGVKTFDALSQVTAFFEERRGRLYGFRWRDWLDHSSAAPNAAVSAIDQPIGIGDGATANFALSKTYGAVYAPYQRPIAKPVSGSVRVAVDGTELSEVTDFTVDPTTGLPMRSIYARANKLDKPIFEATYTYPADIKVETPQFPGAPADKPAEKK